MMAEGPTPVATAAGTRCDNSNKNNCVYFWGFNRKGSVGQLSLSSRWYKSERSPNYSQSCTYCRLSVVFCHTLLVWSIHHTSHTLPFRHTGEKGGSPEALRSPFSCCTPLGFVRTANWSAIRSDLPNQSSNHQKWPRLPLQVPHSSP